MNQFNKKQFPSKIICGLLSMSFFISSVPAFSQDAVVEAEKEASPTDAESVLEEKDLTAPPDSEDKPSTNDGGFEVYEEKREGSDAVVPKPLEKSDSAPQGKKVLRGHVSKLPTGTKLSIIVETPISEESSAINDEVQGKVLKDIYVRNEFAIPAGSIVVGNISDIVQSKKFHRAGRAKIEFKGIKTPDGLNIPINAIVLHKGVIKGKYTKKTSLISAGSVLGPIAAGAGAGALIDSSPLGIGIGAGLGAVAGIGLFLFERGNKLNIKSGDKLNIELTEDAVIPSEATEDNAADDIEKVKKTDKKPKVEMKNFDAVEEEESQ